MQEIIQRLQKVSLVDGMQSKELKMIMEDFQEIKSILMQLVNNFDK